MKLYKDSIIDHRIELKNSLLTLGKIIVRVPLSSCPSTITERLKS
jgi:hypothetical protein